MFGWRRKRDGFEWHEYVRTTILLKRANRRRKIDAMQQAAIDRLKNAQRAAASGLDDARAKAAAGLREAGEKGLSAGGEGVAAASSAAMAFISRVVVATRDRAGSLIGRLTGITLPRGGGLASGVSASDLADAATLALASRISPARAVQIGAVGVAVAAAAGFRVWGRSLDATAIALALVAAVLLAMGLLLARAMYDDGDAAPGLRPAGAMLGWGGAAALLILGLGPLLAPNSDVGDARLAATGGASEAVTTGSLQSSSGLEGHATALSGDTMRISGRVVKLYEIEAPERTQSCKRANGRSWNCGEAAQRALERFTRRDTVTCEIARQAAAGQPMHATCRTAAGTDIGGELVREGHVFAGSGFFASYSAQQDEAKAGKRGVWDGDAQRPAEYRETKWDAAKKKAPGGCPIKGQTSGRSRIYLLPWSSGYDAAKVRPERGGRWFCSENEAREAGWQPARRS